MTQLGRLSILQDGKVIGERIAKPAHTAGFLLNNSGVGDGKGK
jgi:hypothetical protein